MAVHCVPCQRNATGPQGAGRSQNKRKVSGQILGLAGRGQGHACLTGAVLFRQCAQPLPWPCFQQHGVGQIGELREPLSKANRVAQVPGPVIGVCQRLCINPCARQIGDEGHAGSTQSNARHAFPKCFQQAVEQAGMSRDIDTKPAAFNSTLLQALLQLGQRLKRP